MNDEEQADLAAQDAPSAEQSKKAPVRYVLPLEDRALPPQRRALLTLLPLGTPHAELTAFFSHRVSIETVRKWRQGRYAMPPWAIARLALCAERFAACVRDIAPGNSAAIGTQNLLRSHAERRARRAEKAQRQD